MGFGNVAFRNGAGFLLLSNRKEVSLVQEYKRHPVVAPHCPYVLAWYGLNENVIEFGYAYPCFAVYSEWLKHAFDTLDVFHCDVLTRSEC